MIDQDTNAVDQDINAEKWFENVKTIKMCIEIIPENALKTFWKSSFRMKTPLKKWLNSGTNIRGTNIRGTVMVVQL